MAFQLEEQMFRPVQRWLTSQGYICKAEFSTPWGICDLVAASFNSRNIKKRLQYGQRDSIGPMQRVAILCQIPDIDTGRSISTHQLLKRYAGIFEETALEHELNCLVSGKFVQLTENNRFQKRNGWFPLQKKLIAVELKLNRVEEVLRQSMSHRGFADESYTALPKTLAERIVQGPRKTDFERSGIGILSVAPDYCRQILRAKRIHHSVNPEVQMHCMERFWPVITSNAT